MPRSEVASIPGLGRGSDASIHVLHVDDDAAVRDLTSEFLRRKSDQFVVSGADSASAGMAVLDEDDVDCVVSDFDMPGTNGLEFLQAVREDHPEHPFVLFTGKGSEEIASEAISAGVTEYLQKGTGSDQYDLLANRIRNAVEQHRTQREVQAARDWFENVLQHSSDYLFVLDASGQFEYVSPTVKRTLGYDAADVIGDVAFEYVHPDHRARAMKLFEDVVAEPGREVTVELRIERADGTWAWLEIRGRRVADDELVDGVLLNARDVTERKDRERERDRQSDLFERTQRLAKVGGWEYDLANGEIQVTSGTRRLLGFDDGTEPDLDDAIERFHPDDRAKLRAALDRARRAGETHADDYRLCAGSEDYRWVHVKGTPQSEDGDICRIRGVIQDVEEERQYERRIRALHETTRRLILADSPTAIADVATAAAKEIIDLEINGLFLYDASREALVTESLSERAEEIAGAGLALSLEESLAGEAWLAQESRIYDDVRAEPDAHDPNTPIRSEMILPLGEHGVFMASKTVPGGFEERLVVLANILAANVEAALDRIDKHRRLAERERELAMQNDRLDEFTSIVSHDLRNPLNVARGRLEMAREGDDDPEHLAAVDRSLDRMEDLVDELRTLARAGEVVTTREPVDLATVARAAWNTVETGDATLVTDAERTVEADESRLQQLLENLFRNAVEHGIPNGDGASVDGGGDALTVTVGDHPSGFFVSDDGRGIAGDDHEQVFDRGYSTLADGTGLGLQIVTQIAEAHGWTVDATESAEGGARFEFTVDDVHAE